jgi:hypothetical protein
MIDDAPLSHDELATLLAEDERLAVSFRDSTLADEQAVAIDYYEARPFGDEEEGLSQVVTPDVAEVVDYMTISTSRTIVSGDRVVEFESAEADNEAAAEEATAAVTYSFMKTQDGYRVIHDWIQSGLIEKIGIAKTCAETHEKVVKRRGVVSEDQLAALHASGAEIVTATDNGDGSFTVEASERTQEVRFVDYPIPSEEFLFASRTRHEDDSDYLCHRSARACPISSRWASTAISSKACRPTRSAISSTAGRRRAGTAIPLRRPAWPKSGCARNISGSISTATALPSCTRSSASMT